MQYQWPVRFKDIISHSILSFFLFMSLVNPGYVASSEEFPAEPVLRLETGMHSALIRRMDVDRDQRFIVTGSDDKTVRIWDLESGDLVQILRLPISDGNLGKVYCVAISPDASTVAVGGWTGYNNLEGHRIFIFDRQTGTISQVITGLPNIALHLTYSPDGKYLNASLGSANGIRVYDTQMYKQVREDVIYDNSSYWASFDDAGRLVTTSYDGYLRIYDKTFNLILKKQAPGGDYPFAAKFSPDGRRVAVGYFDSPRVDVLSADTLGLLFSADTSNVDSDLFIVAWSTDGQYLYGGGTYDVAGNKPVRRWSKAGRGSYIDLRAGEVSVMGIHPLSGGGLVVGSIDPYLGVLAEDGILVWEHRGKIADFREQLGKNSIQLSFNGDQVQFGFQEWGERPARFSVKTWHLELDPQDNSELTQRAITEAPGLKITDWQDNYTPKLNGKVLVLADFEMSRSMAIAPDHQRFLLGTDWTLRLIDYTGEELWQVNAPSVVWAVNISGDSNVFIAGFGDGTLRWYRLSDGQELLALFPHKDGKRWVAWTPNGFYHASAGAEDLIGWHLNQGSEEVPDFYGASRFRDQFYRPDVVSRVLETLDVKKALALADQARGSKTTIKAIKTILPPTMSILSPAAGTATTSNKLDFFYKAESTTGDITEVIAREDGRPAKVLNHVFDKVKSDRDIMLGTITIEVPAKDAVVSLIARNRHGDSEPVNFATNWAGAKDWFKPNLYVLAIGVSYYDQQHLELKYAAKDARDFVEVIRKQEGGLYQKVKYQLVVSDQTTKEATLDGILDGLEWIERETTSRDVAMVFLSGHGTNDAEGNYNFLPQDGDPARLHRTGIDKYIFEKFLSNIAGKTVLFFDSCRSGNIRIDITKGDQQPDVDKFANELADADSGVIVFSSSTGKQFSLEKEELENGVFTEALIEGFEGQADIQKDSYISIAELEVFLPGRVKELSGGEQKPVSAKPKSVEDLKILRVHR